jgi:hypothetical protein
MKMFNLARASRLQSLRPGFFSLAIAATTALASASECHAGLVLSVENVTTTAGSLGSFDVLITNTNPTNGASYGVAADVLDISLTGTTGVEFTGVTIATTTASYIFPVSGTGPGNPFSSSLFPNTQFFASDSDFQTTSPFERIITPGQSYGLAHVTYQVMAGAAPSMGTISILSDSAGDETSLADFAGNPVGFSTSNGSFIVASAVPEPSALLLTATGLALGCLSRLGARFTLRSAKGEAIR